MRVSACGDDAWQLKFLRCPTIMLDGVEVEHVREADDVLGYVERYTTSPDGAFIRCHCGGAGLVRLDFGRVEIMGVRRR